MTPRSTVFSPGPCPVGSRRRPWRKLLVGDYVDQIRKVQPTGPYHLLGWSMGGHLAHAVAASLRQAGDEVPLLAVLDAYPVEPSLRRPMSARQVYDDLHAGYRRLGVTTASRRPTRRS